LLEQAGDLGHAESLLYLASQYQRGTLLPANEDRANRLFAEAANLRNPKAVVSYARYIAASPERRSETQLIPLLRELADADNAEAMVVLGNLYAKGVSVKRSSRAAVRWYKRAVAQVQASHHGNAAVINEVAWNLAVSNQKGLLKPSYAQAIMDTMMQSNKQVQSHPEYLDTWAATYAANGNFIKAIELQKRALHYARIQERTDVIAILQTHLESFEAGANITDRTP
jgi:TPR repeat protein